jgi:hypothetical protein
MDDALVGSGIFSFVYTTMRYRNEVSWARMAAQIRNALLLVKLNFVYF